MRRPGEARRAPDDNDNDDGAEHHGINERHNPDRDRDGDGRTAH